MHHGAVKIGCPVWAHAPWVGSFFTAHARREDYLPQYASVFGTAEGNATFYGLPAPATVARWADEAPETFRFCFKFPRTISHDARLAPGGPGAGDGPEVRAFAERLAPLGSRLGPRLLQLPSSFGPAGLGALRTWLARARETVASVIAVEVRHPEFFAGGAAEHDLHAALVEAGAERCVFDTTGLFAARLAPDDLAAHDAVRKKPRVPARRVALGRHPLVRFVGDPDLARNDPALDRWAATLAGWLDEGREPYFFAHHVDDRHAPELARRLHARLHALRPERVPTPPAWPCESAAANAPSVRGGHSDARAADPAQLELF